MGAGARASLSGAVWRAAPGAAPSLPLPFVSLSIAHFEVQVVETT